MMVNSIKHLIKWVSVIMIFTHTPSVLHIPQVKPQFKFTKDNIPEKYILDRLFDLE